MAAILAGAGAVLVRQHEEKDTYFRVPDGRLKYRESSARPSRLISYRREDLPTERVSHFEIAELREDSNKTTKSVLASALGEEVVVTKWRQTYEAPGWLVNLDTFLGHEFVEIEIDRAALGAGAKSLMARLKVELGIRQIDILPYSYSQLTKIVSKANEYRRQLGPRLGDLVLIDGPSGAGKSSLVHAVRSLLPEKYSFLKRYTSREERNGDAQTDEYTHVDVPTFEMMVDGGEFLESRDFKFGMSYGISWKQVIEALSDHRTARAVGIMNLGNVRHLREFVPEVRRVLITAPIDQLRSRLEERGAHSVSALEERLGNAQMANEALDLYDFVIWNENGEFGRALDQLKESIIQ